MTLKTRAIHALAEIARERTSMTNAHTPGPWTLGEGFSTAKDHAVCDGPFVIAKVITRSTTTNPHESLHNARLIAAAPDLLTNLTRMLEAYEADKAAGTAFGNDNAAEAARAAIRAAKGE